MELEKYPIFISYRRVGGDALAYLLKKELKEKGYPAFLDIYDLKTGLFDESLLKRIDECIDFILVLGSGALDRCIDPDDWVRKEVNYALSKSKNIIPVMLKGFQWPDDLPDDMKILKSYNGVAEITFQFFDENIDKLISLFSANTGKGRRQEKVLVWSDIPKAEPTLKKFCKKLDSKFEYIIIKDPSRIIYYELNTIHAIILFNTDVTKLSTIEDTRVMLDKRLSDYVEHGGLLLGTHDIIYRRTLNENLQQAFGYYTKYFEAIECVEYHKTDLCKKLNMFTSLGECFCLTDEEICWGDKYNLDDDVLVYFTGNSTKSDEPIPLVLSRMHGNGYCFWINTGETKMKAPRSISLMEEPLILLINEILNIEV